MIALNIDMPKTCRECPCQDMNEEYCQYCYAADKMGKMLMVKRDGRPQECPLIELPNTANIPKSDMMDTVKALHYMKEGKTAFKKSEPNILYTADFDDVSAKYTICKNGEAMTAESDWASFFNCDEWIVKG